MARDHFDTAWRMLEKPVRLAVQRTDYAAVVATLTRFAAHIHMAAIHALGHTREQARKSFLDQAEVCFDQQLRDGSWPDNTN